MSSQNHMDHEQARKPVFKKAQPIIENSHSSSGTICMRNRVEVRGTIWNYLELICCVTRHNFSTKGIPL